MILADKIIENRKKNGWSQEELADKLGVSRQSVSKWEGAQAVPDMKKIIQMSEVFVFLNYDSRYILHLFKCSLPCLHFLDIVFEE